MCPRRLQCPLSPPSPSCPNPIGSHSSSTQLRELVWVLLPPFGRCLKPLKSHTHQTASARPSCQLGGHFAGHSFSPSHCSQVPPPDLYPCARENAGSVKNCLTRTIVCFNQPMVASFSILNPEHSPTRSNSHPQTRLLTAYSPIGKKVNF